MAMNNFRVLVTLSTLLTMSQSLMQPPHIDTRMLTANGNDVYTPIMAGLMCTTSLMYFGRKMVTTSCPKTFNT